jgi:hypothetical protein
MQEEDLLELIQKSELLKKLAMFYCSAKSANVADFCEEKLHQSLLFLTLALELCESEGFSEHRLGLLKCSLEGFTLAEKILYLYSNFPDCGAEYGEALLREIKSQLKTERKQAKEQQMILGHGFSEQFH